MRILVIDGEPVLRAAWKYLLSEQGHDVMVAGNSDDGIAESRSEEPDLVLVDVDSLWPVDQGLLTIETIRDQMPDAQILVLSSWLNRRKALESGANVCLPKPIDFGTVFKLADMMAGHTGKRLRPVSAEAAVHEQFV